MAYQSFFASKPSSAPAKQSNGASGYSSFFGTSTIGQPSQKELADNRKANADAQAAFDKENKQSQPAPQKSRSLFSKVKTGVKDFASSASIGEQKFAQGIARTLPGGTNDLKAQEKSGAVDTKNLKTYTDLHKAGKISDARYKKLVGAVAEQSSDTQKGTADTTKKMPTTAQVGLGAASTAADIVTAGTLPEIKAAVTAAKTANVASKGSKLFKAIKTAAPVVASNAAAGGLNAAAGGGTKSDVIKNTAAGAVLPEVLHYGAKGVVKLLPKAAAKAEKAAAKELPTATHSNPQPGDVIKPTPPPPPAAKLVEDHGKYFTVPKGSQAIPVDKLKTTKPEVANTASAVNAHTRMEQAASGTIDKRAPILVHAQPDGTYHVLDGNATTTVAKGQDWKTLPADVVTSKNVPAPEHIEAAKGLITKAAEENKPFQKNIKDVADSLGLTYHGAEPKSLGRSLTKITDDYAGDHTKLKDSIRSTIEVPDHSAAGFGRVIDRIKEVYPDAVVKDGYKNLKSGYADMKVHITTPNGHKGEIILATPEMLKAKKTGGHALYKISRDETKSDAERKAASDQMQTLYGNAHDSANRRLASGSDLPYSETKNLSASSGETASPAPIRAAGTREAAPETTTVSRTKPSESERTASSTSSSVIKKDGAVIPSTIAKDGENVKGKGNGPKMVEKPVLKPFETAHMVSVGGYTHSTHMETDYADMLREQERAVKGGEIVKNADGTYKRTSEHSRFYRDYYKEYGRAPTKEAYLEEARRQLASGHAAYGASDDYKTLLERENRPIPTMDVKTTPLVPKKEIAHTTGNSRVYERLKAEHPDTLSEDVHYDKLNLKEDAQKATDLVAKDKNKAYRVAMGAEDIKGQTNTAVNIALSEKALDEGNHSLYAQLVKNRSLEQTRRGQEIVAEKGSVTDNSTSRYVKELLSARMQKLGKSFTSDINTKLVKTESSGKRAIATIDKEVAKAQKRIQYKQMDMKNAQSILEQLTCK